MQMRVGEEGVFDVSVYRRRFDYCNRGEGIFAHAKYRRKRGPAYIAFFLFFFFFDGGSTISRNTADIVTVVDSRLACE